MTGFPFANFYDMASQKELDLNYIKIAKIRSELSKARRLQVGAILVKGDFIISDGFNGTAKGRDNNCETEQDGKLVTKKEVLHAETNCISKIAKSTMSSDGATLYCTHSCCMDCAKLIVQSGIVRFVYSEEYRSREGLEFLKDCGVKVEQI
jgi:dCMP deaminase